MVLLCKNEVKFLQKIQKDKISTTMKILFHSGKLKNGQIFQNWNGLSRNLVFTPLQKNKLRPHGSFRNFIFVHLWWAGMPQPVFTKKR